LVEKFPSALHCTHKHLTAAKKGIEETLAKLYKECKAEVCEVSKATRLEAEEVVSDLNKAESHCAEVLSKLEIPELRQFYHEIRAVRKRVYETNLPYLGKLRVGRSAIKVFEGAYRATSTLLERLGEVAEKHYDELKEVSCPKCEEELEKKVEAMKKVVESANFATKEYKSNPHNPNSTMVKTLEDLVKPCADMLGIRVDQLSPAFWGELFAALSEIPVDFFLHPLAAKIVKGISGLIVGLGLPKAVEEKARPYCFEAGTHLVVEAFNPRPEDLATVLREARKLGYALGKGDWEGVRKVLVREELPEALQDTARAAKELVGGEEEVPAEFVCEICGESFATEEELKRHKKEAHPEVVLPPIPIRRFIG